MDISNRHMEKYIDKVASHQFSARRAVDRCLLSSNDRVQHVLNDNEPIDIGEDDMLASFHYKVLV
jgi:hypothetical protein